jgi:hypothetical protein
MSTIAACRNYCRQPAARGIDSYFINFVFERASQRNILAVRYTISNVGISFNGRGLCTNQRLIHRHNRKPYFSRILSHATR